MDISIKVLKVVVYDKETSETSKVEFVSEKKLTFKEVSKILELSPSEKVIDVQLVKETVSIPLDMLEDLRTEQNTESKGE